MAQRAVPHLSHVAQRTPVGGDSGLNLNLGPFGLQGRDLREAAPDYRMGIQVCNPRPVPLYGRVIDESTWANRSKMTASLSVTD